jgi:hypothetical protein
MTPEVEQAIQEIRAAFDGHVVEVVPEDQGGAYVTVRGVTIAPGSTPAQSWIGFLIPFQYPHADVYPHFISADVRRAQDDSYGEAVTPSTWQGRPALQVSRKSNRWNPATDTAALKLAKVIRWLQTR